MRWVINIPVWGEAYRTRWLERGYPAICAALDYAGFPEHRWVIHTDAELFKKLPEWLHDDVTWLPRPREISSSAELGTADRQGFAETQPGEAIMFLNADMIPSVEVFKRCEEIFRQTGKTFISCPAIRVERGMNFLAGISGKELADLALKYAHQFTTDCVWGKGRCKLPPYLIFEKDDRPGNVVMHAFDLHPLAIFKDREFDLYSPTASEFIQEFPWEKIYVVRTPEMIIAEPVVSCDYARFRTRTFSKRDVVDWARHSFASSQQQWQFRAQIILRGLYDPQAQAVANDIAYTLMQPKPWWQFTMPSTMSARIAIGMAVPAPLRRLIPKPIRERIKNFEWREIGWPRP